jgi:hypothetical protein
MTALALSATVLRERLERHDPSAPEFPRQFFASQARIQHDPWKLSAGVDLRFPFSVGERPFSMRLFNLYLDRIQAAARYPTVRQRLVEVAQLIRPISDLYQPAIAGRVAAASVTDLAWSLSEIVTRPEPKKITPMPSPMAQEPMRSESAAA